MPRRPRQRACAQRRRRPAERISSDLAAGQLWDDPRCNLDGSGYPGPILVREPGPYSPPLVVSLFFPNCGPLTSWIRWGPHIRITVTLDLSVSEFTDELIHYSPLMIYKILDR